MTDDLRRFLRRNPLVQWVLALPVGLLFTQLARLVGGESLKTTSREQTVMVIVAAGLVLVGGVFSVLAQLDLKSRARRWRIVSLVVTGVAFIVFITASALAKPPPTVDDISSVSDPGTGIVTVKVAAHDLRGRHRLVVRAEWPGGSHSKTSGHKDGDAQQEFTAGPAAESGDLRIVAYVKGAGDDPPGGFECGDYDECADSKTQMRPPPPPDLRTSVRRRALEIVIPKNEKAPSRAVVLVFRRGRELFKDNPLVTERDYRRVIGLKPRRRNGADQICVLATYQVEALDGCAANPGVSRNVFDAPR